MSNIIRNYQIPLTENTINSLRVIFDRKTPNSELIQSAINEFIDAYQILGGKQKGNIYEENLIIGLLLEKYPGFDRDSKIKIPRG